MANIKDVKSHIKSVSDTLKITNAMYLISSTKLRTGKEVISNYLPYVEELEKEAGIICSAECTNESTLLSDNGCSNEAFLIIAAEKGLAGDYTKSIVNYALENAAGKENVTFYIVGNAAKKLFAARNIEYEKSFDFQLKSPDFETAKKISEYFTDSFEKRKTGRLTAVYSDFGNGAHQKLVSKQILPIEIRRTEQRNEYEFAPDKKTVAKKIIPAYITGIIFSIILHGFCSEHSARMIAMDGANRNAKTILDNLTVQYNRMRQNAITQEIAEISGERKQK